ncbi:P-loop containing nucleoside triphosphate hydrolase protein [Aulographum hederae CBS 113979]|uniref:DNA 3'-5' helicase n=1 Tax=Aulographum hederae CBS 113979 TaxID=1176131 RepID=A0A6G1HF38_9PEZI|nr:P-loop containing nucleoside triphosphate hydrolase protein [Aulographum hederae CBS 113979]
MVDCITDYPSAPINPLSHYAYQQPQRAMSSSPRGDIISSPSAQASQRRIIPARPHPGGQSRVYERESPVAEFRPEHHAAGSKESQGSRGLRLVQGIEIISTRELPDRFRSLYAFPNFNAVQSKCFETVYKTGDNFVVSSPTGSGKTVILELAICRAIQGFPNGQFKIVYQAPTKSLCSERHQDWKKRFGPLGLECAELTGDTSHVELRNVANATIIVTTPEKWDAMTRKWKDHAKLMQLVKLFLIDEVHILKEDRGATLEAVVSRMKSVGSQVRFVALSATVPNSDDIATWLGKDPMNQHLSAAREVFGEEFRPVKLQKHVVGFHASNSANDFVFDKMLDSKLPEVICKYSHKKPIMIFCPTRASTVATAKVLAKWWATKGPRDRYWESPRREVKVTDPDLKKCLASAVAYHNAGVELHDRKAVEEGFLSGNVNVICCTSTLAVGINLPCHFVIIKNTVSYIGSATKEYSDLEVMQMLGRAGRPQFDVSAVAVIMTRQEKTRHYEKMVSGQEILESCLHLNLIDHLNAEIGLGTVTDVESAKKWLNGTFLYVRLKKNPSHYRLEGDSGRGQIDDRIEEICCRDLEELQKHDLVTGDNKLRTTEYGEAMARYYLRFPTMVTFLQLPQRPKLSEILSCLAQAVEFKEIRFRSGEKALYKDLNKSPSIKFPIHVDLALPAHKVSLIIQSVLGGADLPTDEKTAKHLTQYQKEVAMIFQHTHRLICCIIDCQLHREDSIGIRNALTLGRSLGARVWDDSPMQMRQIEGIGIVSVRKLVNAGITSIEALEATEAHRIETVLSRHPPYGLKLLDKLRGFPRLRVHVKTSGSPTRQDSGVRVNIKAEIGFMNERPPETFLNKDIYIVFLAESSDGHKIHFARLSAKKLSKGQDVLFSAVISHQAQSINCFVMCDGIAGTCRQASLKPDIPPSWFPLTNPHHPSQHITVRKDPGSKLPMNTSRRRIESPRSQWERMESEEYGNDGVDDSDLVQAAAGLEDLDFEHIDDYSTSTAAATRRNTAKNAGKSHHATNPATVEDWQPTQLPNGKYACNHKCRDKTACKHLCCRDGVDKPPKAPKGQNKTHVAPESTEKSKKSPLTKEKGQTTLPMSLNAQKGIVNLPNPMAADIPIIDLSNDDRHQNFLSQAPKEYKNLSRLHDSVQKTPQTFPACISSKMPGFLQALGARSRPAFLQDDVDDEFEDIGDDFFADDDHMTALVESEKMATGEASRARVQATSFITAKQLARNNHPAVEEPVIPSSDAASSQSRHFGSVAPRSTDYQESALDEFSDLVDFTAGTGNDRNESRAGEKDRSIFVMGLSSDVTAGNDTEMTSSTGETLPKTQKSKRSQDKISGSVTGGENQTIGEHPKKRKLDAYETTEGSKENNEAEPENKSAVPPEWEGIDEWMWSMFKDTVEIVG